MGDSSESSCNRPKLQILIRYSISGMPDSHVTHNGKQHRSLDSIAYRESAVVPHGDLIDAETSFVSQISPHIDFLPSVAFYDETMTNYAV
ncbi:hypothetical protein HN011_005328 [Eciton burchellii]|nr:hypothetical protein HN011_005328 [Eciton burchellii]